jgi:hypothetical protein
VNLIHGGWRTSHSPGDREGTGDFAADSASASEEKVTRLAGGGCYFNAGITARWTPSEQLKSARLAARGYMEPRADSNFDGPQ